ncbi:hypothetical protein C7M84_014533 [Penaeus vannamei]|uniref:Uncharacterized protein n=1 Tax=Penaeus vannamei TaxID=6689 RepID=A0A423ST59_PENVA|nr:hypothetical protein C7M84_014533 [Penaeus vannamei]
MTRLRHAIQERPLYFITLWERDCFKASCCTFNGACSATLSSGLTAIGLRFCELLEGRQVRGKVGYGEFSGVGEGLAFEVRVEGIDGCGVESRHSGFIEGGVGDVASAIRYDLILRLSGQRTSQVVFVNGLCQVGVGVASACVVTGSYGRLGRFWAASLVTAPSLGAAVGLRPLASPRGIVTVILIRSLFFLFFLSTFIFHLLLHRYFHLACHLLLHQHLARHLLLQCFHLACHLHQHFYLIHYLRRPPFLNLHPPPSPEPPPILNLHLSSSHFHHHHHHTSTPPASSTHLSTPSSSTATHLSTPSFSTSTPSTPSTSTSTPSTLAPPHPHHPPLNPHSPFPPPLPLQPLHPPPLPSRPHHPPSSSYLRPAAEPSKSRK